MLGPTRRLLATALIGAAASVGCVSVNAISPDRADAERAAIQHDLRNDRATLCKIASERAKRGKPELRGRQVVCAIADIQTTFKSETHAVHAISYACGIAPWQPNKTPAVATPKVVLDLLKEGQGIWTVNGFL